MFGPSPSRLAPPAFLASPAGVLYGAYGYACAVDALVGAVVSRGLARSPEAVAALPAGAAAFLASLVADRFWSDVGGEVALGMGLHNGLLSAARAPWVLAVMAE